MKKIFFSFLLGFSIVAVAQVELTFTAKDIDQLSNEDLNKEIKAMEVVVGNIDAAKFTPEIRKKYKSAEDYLGDLKSAHLDRELQLNMATFNHVVAQRGRIIIQNNLPKTVEERPAWGAKLQKAIDREEKAGARLNVLLEGNAPEVPIEAKSKKV